MLDINFIRKNPEALRQNFLKRGLKERVSEVDEILETDKKLRKLKGELDSLRSERNSLSEKINQTKKEKGDISVLVAKVKALPQEIKEKEDEYAALEQHLRGLLLLIPNILHESVPQGVGEEDNVAIREEGRKPEHKFSVKSHVDLLESKKLADLERAAKISGARFYFLKNELVLLEQALIKFALDFLYKKDFTLIEPPFMMKQEPYEGVTDLKDFEDVMYKIEDEDLFLIATSEHPMAAMHKDETFAPEELPIKYAGVSPCFRKEAGAHGKDTKGIFRVHQFTKVEQFVFCKPEDSWKHFDELLANAEEILQHLKLPYRVVAICSGDIGNVASKKIDLEVWMPASGQYREVVSCSNVLSYQAARLNIKYGDTEKKDYVHTLNSTAIATTRMMVAIMENFQNEDGSFNVPEALHPYLHGIKKIP